MAAVDESAVVAAQNLRIIFSRLRRKLLQVSTDEDLSPSQTAVLIRLAKNGPASTSQLAGAESVRPQSMATTLAALDRHGLIDRTPDPDDRRRKLIALTRVGRRHAENGRRMRQEWLVDAMQNCYTETERRVIKEALKLLGRITD